MVAEYGHENNEQITEIRVLPLYLSTFTPYNRFSYMTG